MAKRRRYGDAWKDVQIDAEQNDAVFDRFFKRTQHDPEPPDAAEEAAPPPAGEATARPAPKVRTPAAAPAPRREKRQQARATVRPISPALPSVVPAADTAARVDALKRQYRLSKGEAAVLKYLLDRAREGGGDECYAKVPQLADACEMTHRGCQFALKNLEARGFVIRLRDYDPANRLGIQFRITIPSA